MPDFIKTDEFEEEINLTDLDNPNFTFNMEPSDLDEDDDIQ